MEKFEARCGKIVFFELSSFPNIRAKQQANCEIPHFANLSDIPANLSKMLHIFNYKLVWNVFLYLTLFVDADWRYLWFWPTLAYTHWLSLSVSPLSSSLPPFTFWINTLISPVSIFNWNIDFNALGCSHFKGNINTKLMSPVGMKSLCQDWEQRKSKNVLQKFLLKLWCFLL